MLLGINNYYLLAFQIIVILVCYSGMISKLVIALKHREYGAAKVQVLLLSIVTVIVAGIYIILKI